MIQTGDPLGLTSVCFFVSCY